ncbi:hypothetical protein [Paenibacillus macquariensis]|uniref:Uncharacterized protein n=1 Tax=Paenibacillus macquariensis TaxID=948756 RepID=A0ABY1JWZ4_9BACL|nr:hypothetical protein [Paenibacillus macquariensis]MEC0089397.1 hypothetical protein [Paenibacillus macquariensis]OAB33215.1 hypothetical protein PMSM_14450 [Paenibacillus macquariensis subsp. macquariensis]SIQ92160.1 hypothetical protein SAMN05421578_10561 [Paenibacillus macquariensis]
MFSPFFIEISLKHSGVDLKKVEFDLIRPLKEQYGFEETEILKDSIELRNGNKIMTCSFTEETLTVVFASEADERVIEIIQLVYSEMNLKHVSFKRLEMVGLFLVQGPETILNLNLSSLPLKHFDITLETRAKDGEGSIRIRLMSDEGDKYNYASVNLSSSRDLISFDEFKEFYVLSYKELNDIANGINSPDNNLSYVPIEVKVNE